jgi:tetratricopeptide (TPR) repeat protein
MTEEKLYTEAEASKFFAIAYNGKTWGLLDKANRTSEENELMLYTAIASLRHWLDVGTGVHRQRGEWLIARVYSVLGQAEAALRHTDRCLALTEDYADLMEDLDHAFSYECVARANAIAGNRNEALTYVRLAEEAGRAIAGEQDREYFLDDLNGGDWGDVR